MISVIIPVRDEATYLPEQLDALSRQTFTGEWEVIIADNGSRDASVACAREHANRLPRLRIVDASERKGPSHARNVGVGSARGDFVIFCDGDDVVSPDWLEHMAEAAARCDAVGGAITAFTADVTEERSKPPTAGLRTWPGFLPFASGANCGVRRSLFDELGGFDEGYVGGADDIEFFWRLQLAGHRLCFLPDAVVSYRERASALETARQSFRYGRMDAQLYRDFRSHGMPRRSVVVALQEWGRLLVAAPWHLLDGDRRRRWAQRAGRRLGRLVGAVRFRTLYL